MDEQRIDNAKEMVHTGRNPPSTDDMSHARISETATADTASVHHPAAQDTAVAAAGPPSDATTGLAIGVPQAPLFLSQRISLQEPNPPGFASADQLEHRQQGAPRLSSGQKIDAKNTLQSNAVVDVGPAADTVTAETSLPAGFYKQIHGTTEEPAPSPLLPKHPLQVQPISTSSLPMSSDPAIATSVSSLSAPLEPTPTPLTVSASPTVVPRASDESPPVFATACVVVDDGCETASRSLPVQSISPDSTTVSNTNSYVSGFTDASVTPPNKQFPLPKRCVALIALGLALVASIVLGLLCGTGRCSPSRSIGAASDISAPAASGTSSNSSIETTVAVSDFIQSVTLSGRDILSLHETSKHQLAEERALQWLMYEDPLLLQPTDATNRFRLQQRYALQTLFMQCNQSSVTLTLTASMDECEWWGVACQSTMVDGVELDVVSALALSSKQLSGSLPPDVGLLSTGLVYLNVSHNDLAGSLPESLDQCTNLELLDLNYNHGFVGTIPPSWGTQWTNLRHFSIAASDLTGSLPTELGNWTSLAHFDVDDNVLTGTIPPVFGEQWTNLVHFGIGVSDHYASSRINRLTGTIPTTVALWTSLRHCNLAWNLLEGTLSQSLQKWTALEFFDVFENGLVGTLPALGTTVLRHFDVNSNFFVGSLPEAYTLWTNLEYFDVNDNQLTGTLSESFATWSSLRYFSLAINAFHGSLPQVVGSAWPKLEEFDIGVNLFNGSLPNSIGNWRALMRFAVNDNDLTGTIPSSVGQWTAFSDVFNADRNELTGTLPDSIGQWSHVTDFSVAVNGLTGTIPKSIESWTMINTVHLEANNFSGVVPDGICDTNVTDLVADCIDEVTCSCCTLCNATLDPYYFWGT